MLRGARGARDPCIVAGTVPERNPWRQRWSGTAAHAGASWGGGGGDRGDPRIQRFHVAGEGEEWQSTPVSERACPLDGADAGRAEDSHPRIGHERRPDERLRPRVIALAVGENQHGTDAAQGVSQWLIRRREVGLDPGELYRGGDQGSRDGIIGDHKGGWVLQGATSPFQVMVERAKGDPCTLLDGEIFKARSNKQEDFGALTLASPCRARPYLI